MPFMHRMFLRAVAVVDPPMPSYQALRIPSTRALVRSAMKVSLHLLHRRRCCQFLRVLGRLEQGRHFGFLFWARQAPSSKNDNKYTIGIEMTVVKIDTLTRKCTEAKCFFEPDVCSSTKKESTQGRHIDKQTFKQT